MKRSLKRWLWFLLAMLISTGVYFTIRYGLRPKPIPVMNPTQFEDPQQIGAVIYKRLRQEARAERLILLGSSPELNDYAKIWTGFLKTALADELKVDVFYQREGLVPPDPLPALPVQSFSPSQVVSGLFLDQVRAQMEAGHLVIIYATTQEVSHLLKTSLSRALEEIAHHPVLSLSTLSVSLKPEEQAALQAQCLEPNSDNEGSARLLCSEARVSKLLLKKKIAPDQIWAVIERHGLKEYLVFVHPKIN